MTAALAARPAPQAEEGGSLRILQVTSDWKWTGPAEPMLRLALALRERGHRVWLSCPAPPEGAGRSLASEAAAAGLPAELLLEPAEGFRPLADAGEVLRLRRLMAREQVDLVHAWHTRDHLLALRAAGLLRRRVALVRSWRQAEAIARHPGNRWLLGPGTDGLLCVSPETARRNAGLRGGRPVAGSFGAVDLQRFHPEPGGRAARAGLGLAPEHRVVGVVARVQAHRRFDLLFAAAARLFARDPLARLLVVGRGTRREELAEVPARRLGIADRVVFAGYRTDDYRDVLRAMDVLAFLVPGSDGTCRALLEAAACGIPAVVTRRGALPEIVLHGETGLVVDEDEEALAGAFQRLLGDAAWRELLGRAARARAERLFAPERLAEAALSLYGAALEARAGAAGRRRRPSPGEGFSPKAPAGPRSGST